MMLALKLTQEMRFSIEQVDALTGPVMGRPKSATYRTADLVGLDTLAFVAKTAYDKCAEDDARDLFKLPPVLESLIEKEWLGQKSGQGFYKKEGKDIYALDLEKMEYNPKQKPRMDGIGVARRFTDLGKKHYALVYNPDPAGRFAWELMIGVLAYAADRVGEIADDIVSIDQAMKWGFAWELGPFETWDAIGVERSVHRMEREGKKVPAFVRSLLDSGEESFYRGCALLLRSRIEGDEAHRHRAGRRGAGGQKGRRQGGAAQLERLAGRSRRRCRLSGVPLGAAGSDEPDRWRHPRHARTVAREGRPGGNERSGHLAPGDAFLRRRQPRPDPRAGPEQTVRRHRPDLQDLPGSDPDDPLRPRFEMVAPCHQIVALAELYCGAVEVGVGLIPGAGGNLRLLTHMAERLPAKQHGPMAAVQKAFETIAFAKISASAYEAVELGYLREDNLIVLSRDHQIAMAKEIVLTLAKDYQAPKPTELVLPGLGGKLAIQSVVQGFRLTGKISKHDAHIAKGLAHLMTGGSRANGIDPVEESYLLELEREVFVSLAGEEKSQARMAHMLKTGKPLRN
jgi:3-hydroxyacyl-CoA dehydrogenase